MLRNSSFNVFLEQNEDYPVLLFNTLTKKSYRFSLPWDSIVSEANKDKQLGKRLLAEQLLTEAGNYMDEVAHYFNIRKQIDCSQVVVCFTITTECAFDCDYCFQRHLKRQPSSEAVIHRFIKLFQCYLDQNPQVKVVDLILFGGEPLIRYELCCKLLLLMSELGMKRNVKIVSMMTTSGMIANAQALDKLNESGLGGVQISFDGPENEHETARSGTFATISNNLPAFASRFGLSIKYNITKKNSRSDLYTEFIDHVDNILGKGQYRIILEAIQATPTATNPHDYFEFESNELADAMVSLAKITNERGIPHNPGAAFHPPCFLTMGNSVMIQPDGNISACNTAYNMPAFIIGNVMELKRLPMEQPWVKNETMSAIKKFCRRHQCALVPLCESGCFYEKLRRNLKFSDVICRYEYIERFIPYLYHLYLGPKK